MFDEIINVKFGYLHAISGPDMDGSTMHAEWVSDEPQKDDPDPRQGWYAELMEITEDGSESVGWVGPFETEADAKDREKVEAAFIECMWGEDPMGSHHGRNE